MKAIRRIARAMAAGRASGQSRNYESIERIEAGYVSNISNSQLNREAKKASENTPKTAISLTWENAKRLLFKTNNTYGADFSRFGWSDGVSASDGGAFGSNLVRMVLSRFPLAAGIRTADFDFSGFRAFVPSDCGCFRAVAMAG